MTAPAAAAATPPRLRAIIASVIALGLASVTVSAVLTAGHDVPEAWRLVVAVVAFVLGDSLLLDLRFGKDRYSFTGSEAAVVLALVVVPAAWAPLTACVGVGLAHVLARRQFVKVAFNAALAAFAVSFSVLAYALVAPLHTAGRPVTPLAWLALAVGTCAFFLCNHFSVSAAVAASQGLPLREVAGHGLTLAIIVLAGNTAMGIVLVALATSYPPVMVGVPFFGALLLLAYRGYLRAMQERDAWEVLHETSGQLVGLDPMGVARMVVERAPSLFRAEFVGLMLVDDDEAHALALRWSSPGPIEEVEGGPEELAGTFWGRARSEQEPFELRRKTAAAPQRAELERRGLTVCIVVPLVTHGQCIGTLRLGFRGNVRFAARELQVLTTFANHVTSALENARLVEAMADERRKLSRIVGTSSDGILSVDGEGRILSWNAAMESISGRPEIEMVGQPLPAGVDMFTEEGQEVSPEWLRAAVSTSDQVQVSAALRNPGSSSLRWLSVSISAVRNAAGDLAFAVLVARDVTATREIEEAKQDFVATVSHELRTPLTPLKGFLLTLKRPDVQLGDLERQSFYSRMLDQTERLERLIEDLLSISRMDRGTFTIDAVPTDVVAAARRVIEQQPREVELACGDGTLRALADPQRFEQVLANLVDNAVKYSPAEAAVAVDIRTEDGMTVVRVRDEGPGIPDEHLEAVFERFRRLGNHLTRDVGGTGLGLYIARRLVQSMGGRIWAESTVGEGSTFTFTLPEAPPAEVEVDLGRPRLVAVAGR